ncbi:hypothetical protein BGW80DRAFT_1295364 [Lactifluus volemus]|nr:hypothetical protein BGW80DRAFT_1295364 [Lactifluus volemus]
MDPQPQEPRGLITDWDEHDVQLFLSHLGLPQYEAQVKAHNLTGEVLCMIGPDDLKEIGITTVGQRLAILKAIYLMKIAHDVTFESDHYIPPSEASDLLENLTIDKLYNLLRQQEERLKGLEKENRRLSEAVVSTVDGFHAWRLSQHSMVEGSSIGRQPSFKWAQYDKSSNSPTKPEMSDSPHPSPNRLEHDLTSRSQLGMQNKNANNSSTTLSTQPSTDNLKTFKVSLEDPAWKVLPAALRKYKINNDDWQNYAMFICYGGPTDNRVERCLSYDEKPLLLFQKLKDASKNPVFMLKHIKDIRSPIAVAQQKQAARKAYSDSTSSKPKSGSSHTRQPSRPPRLQMHPDASALVVPPPMTGTSAQPGWPDVMSPALDGKDREDATDQERLKNAAGSEPPKSAGPNTAKDPYGAEVTVSYAVAIYPYMAEQEDEFDVIVNDAFIIISRARGWWVVQRDPTGSGIVDNDTAKQGWVPAGCLLETLVPVATAKKGDEELDLFKDDVLRVFKRYNHWSYAVKEDGGNRGWVPSWYIGKVSSSSTAPATPNVALASMNNISSLNLDEPPTTQQSQVSPMSSAFPLQARPTTVA